MTKFYEDTSLANMDYYMNLFCILIQEPTPPRLIEWTQTDLLWRGAKFASLPKGSKPGECRVDGVFCFLMDQTKSRNPGQRYQSRKAYPHHLKSKQSITYIYLLKWFKSIWSREFQKHSLVSCREPGVRVRYYNPWAGWFNQGLCSGLPLLIIAVSLVLFTIYGWSTEGLQKQWLAYLPIWDWDSGGESTDTGTWKRSVGGVTPQISRPRPWSLLGGSTSFCPPPKSPRVYPCSPSIWFSIEQPKWFFLTH